MCNVHVYGNKEFEFELKFSVMKPGGFSVGFRIGMLSNAG